MAYLVSGSLTTFNKANPNKNETKDIFVKCSPKRKSGIENIININKDDKRSNLFFSLFPTIKKPNINSPNAITYTMPSAKVTGLGS